MQRTTVERGYGYQHRKLRDQWTSWVEAGYVHCARCGDLIDPNASWDLGHNEDRIGYSGPEHSECNRSTTKAGQPYLRIVRRPPVRRIRNCNHCGCEYRAGYREQRYCSRLCARAAQAATRPAPASAPATSKIITRSCFECGQTFTAATNGRYRICSEQCAKRRHTRRRLERYHSDPEFRALVIERAKASYRRRAKA
jgi:hypothetical protein